MSLLVGMAEDSADSFASRDRDPNSGYTPDFWPAIGRTDPRCSRYDPLSKSALTLASRPITPYQYHNKATPKSYGDQERFGVSFVIGQRVPQRSKPL